jgi:hypothetical protein
VSSGEEDGRTALFSFFPGSFSDPGWIWHLTRNSRFHRLP